jgi:adenine-specific DNA methylase
MSEDPNSTHPPLANAPSFIDRQFPVAKVSMESYKERTAKQSQTLTGLGKWWGRKPLVLVRAALLGLLMPASDDAEKDREIFLKLMTMDREGLWKRKNKNISLARLLEELKALPPNVKKRVLDPKDETKLARLDKEGKEELQRLVFERMPYAEKITYCNRPEQIDGPSPEAWDEINAHLSTHAANLNELVQELGEKRFGHTPRVGDAFCGGGSIPFEAARMGCDAYGSDLNPAAALLTWASLNIVGGGQDVVNDVVDAQKKVFKAVDRQITEWGIEHNSLGWRADAYLYCAEVIDPESDWTVPLLPTFVIGEKTHTVIRLIPDEENRRFEIRIIEGVSNEDMKIARASSTVKGFRLAVPGSDISTPLETIRRNMRMWEKSDFMPRADDIFQERLYCIRWVETYTGKNGKEKSRRYYRSPTVEDFQRENKVKQLLAENFSTWQENGYLSSRKIEPGKDINRPTNSRGYTYWHHLFTARQLLITGLFAKSMSEANLSHSQSVGVLLGIGRLTDWNSRISRWNSNAANEKGEQTFYKPSLATPPSNHACRAFSALDTVFLLDLNGYSNDDNSKVILHDARKITNSADIWITDPPYADAVNYHQLSEFFLSWYDEHLKRLFPTWYTDSKRSLAVVGSDMGFRESMVTCYRNLAEKMPENGMQLVMFTHQDTAVWADLTMILWAAGLRVTAAWTIATETDSALKQGNYVQGTVLLALRKRTTAEPVFLDEINQQIESEVRRQLDEMTRLEDDSDPNFGDADYQLAAYAAALRVLTSQPIEEINPEREILRERRPGEVSPVEELIRRGVKIACDHLIPRNLDSYLWKQLGAMERFYLKGLEVESHGEYRSGVYQELARGFGAADYTDLLESTKANETRLKTASEFGKRNLSGGGFSGSLTRQCLFAIAQTVKSEDTRDGLNYLHTELPDYWASRERIIHLLDYLAVLHQVASMDHWKKDAKAASLLAGAVRNDHV